MIAAGEPLREPFVPVPGAACAEMALLAGAVRESAPTKDPMYPLLAALALCSAFSDPETRPIQLTVVDEAARPIPNAEVLLVDAEDVEEPEFWVDVDLVRWIADQADRKATPLLRTDGDGVLAIDDAPRDVWGLIRDRDRSAVLRIHPRDHRNRRVTLQVDRPLRIRTVDGDGRLVQGASVEVLQSYHGTRCGYWLELGTLLIDAAGEAMLRNPRYYVDAYVLEKPAESARIVLCATAADTRTVYRQLDPAECVSGGVVEVVLASKPESPALRQDRTVRLQLRDNAGAAHRDGYVWFTIAGDPNGPLARETRRGACKNGCVQVTFAGDLPGDADQLRGKRGPAAGYVSR